MNTTLLKNPKKNDKKLISKTSFNIIDPKKPNNFISTSSLRRTHENNLSSLKYPLLKSNLNSEITNSYSKLSIKQTPYKKEKTNFSLDNIKKKPYSIKNTLITPNYNKIRNDTLMSSLKDNNSQSRRLESVLNDSLSSESSIESIECALNFKELVKSIRHRLTEIERDFVMDNLFNCLRYHVSYNSYGSLTLQTLEKFAKMKVISHTNLPHFDKTHDIYSISSRNSINPYLTQSIMDSIPKFFKHLNLLQHIFQVAQRDLLFNVLAKELKDNQKSYLNQLTKTHQGKLPGTRFTNFLSESKQNLGGIQSPPLELQDETGQFTTESRISKSNAKTLKRLYKYHQYLYELNEKLTLLLNDHHSSNIKLLSEETLLPQKYEFFKNAEYILRLIPDIIFKLGLLLKLCLKCYDLTENLLTPQSNSIVNASESKRIKFQKELTNKNSLPITGPLVKIKNIDMTENTRLYSKSSKETDNIALDFRRIDHKKSVEYSIRELDNSVISDEERDQNFYDNEEPNQNLEFYFIPNSSNPFNVLNEQNLKKLEESSLPKMNIVSQHKVLPPISKVSQLQKSEKKVENVEIKKDYQEDPELNDIYDEYLKKKEEIKICEAQMDELRVNLKNLITRTERCISIEDKINSLVNLISQTEKHLSNIEENDSETRQLVQKELNLMNYRLKLERQDLEIEKTLQNDINDAINEVEIKLQAAKIHYEELNIQLNKLNEEIRILYKEFFVNVN